MSPTLLVIGLSVAQATPSLEATRERVGREHARLLFLRTQEDSSLRALAEVEASIEDRSSRAEALAKAIKDSVRQVERAKASLRESAERLEARVARAALRGRALVALQTGAAERVLLGIEDPVKLRRTEDRLDFILRHDLETAEEIRSLQAGYRRMLNEVRSKEKRLRQERLRLEDEQSTLKLVKAQRAILVQALSKERRRSSELKSLLEEAEQRLRTNSLRGSVEAPQPAAGGFSAQRGLLLWPVAGRVEVPFGPRVHSKTGAVLPHNGLDLRASDGDSVHVVFDGIVRYAGVLPSWGQVVVVEHDAAYLSTYAHLQDIHVRTGDRVRRGAALGVLGLDASPKGAFLYFALHNGNEPMDPLAWLAR
ncbi:MAG: murein hydrolase activator EnvC family protein [Myxococcota bacterium]